MYTLTLVAQKGGTSKTTLAINLSVAAERAGWRAALVDLDPQASAAGWSDYRDAETPAVAAVRRHGADLVVIDTAPHSESSALAAALAADFALVPLRPAVLDLRALRATADICALARIPSAVVLNQAPPRGPLAEQADEAAASRGLGVAPCRIGARVAFQHSIAVGLGVLEHEPEGKAARKIRDLFGWARSRLES